jgi:hypothetical protein
MSLTNPSVTEAWQIVIAGVGGIVVLVGIIWEKYEEMTEKAAESRGEHHLTSPICGCLILSFGIIIETLIAGYTAGRDWNMRPLNQQAVNAEAFVTLWTAGTNNPRQDILKPMDLATILTMSSKLAFGNPDRMKTGAPTLYSPILSDLDFPIDGPNRRWEIKFQRDDFVFWNKPPATVREVLNWQKFELGVPFMRTNAEIIKGQIAISVNDSPFVIVAKFGHKNIISATPGNLHAFWNSLTNGIAIFDETNTHSLFR